MMYWIFLKNQENNQTCLSNQDNFTKEIYVILTRYIEKKLLLSEKSNVLNYSQFKYSLKTTVISNKVLRFS